MNQIVMERIGNLNMEETELEKHIDHVIAAHKNNRRENQSSCL